MEQSPKTGTELHQSSVYLPDMRLTPVSYTHLDVYKRQVNMEGKLAATNNYVDIEWSQRARQIEKGYTYENRLAELCLLYTSRCV